MARKKKPAANVPTLRDRIIAYLADNGPCNIAQLEVAMPDQHRSSLYRQLKRAVEAGQLVTGTENDLTVWMTPHMNVVYTGELVELRSRLTELFELNERPVTTLMQNANPHDVGSFDGLMAAAIGNAILHDNPYNRETAERFLTALIKVMGNLLELLQVIDKLLPHGFDIPPYFAKHYHMLQDVLGPAVREKDTE